MTKDELLQTLEDIQARLSVVETNQTQKQEEHKPEEQPKEPEKEPEVESEDEIEKLLNS